jgi:hypothetical protein
MAVGAERREVREGVVTLLAATHVVVHLEILQRSTLLTPPPVSLQHPFHQSAVSLLPQLDPFHLF